MVISLLGTQLYFHAQRCTLVRMLLPQCSLQGASAYVHACESISQPGHIPVCNDAALVA